ncbi:hypothetical protein TSUD_226910 [Trifolium subterraneum]|uniref:Ribosomal RNA-processing protein 14/surfeit locus protein 6 C-terminal domain-containing protein n=1 Tax=Trifolium subterraneum TaxID=3900 RepID=A0A2Z6MZX8_TRISU|nr:hypothetical protein TSUD_226910 [Trifolium subterraneum]
MVLLTHDVLLQGDFGVMRIRKKQKDVAEAVDAGQDLESAIKENANFFDKLIELIPAKFYLPTDDNEKSWFQGLNKKKKAEAKRQTKENIRRSREDRLNPDKPSESTLDRLKKSLEKEKVKDGDEKEDAVKPFEGLEDDRSVTYEELRERFHRKLKGFQSSRNCADPEKAAKKRYERDARRGYLDKKRKRDNETEESKPAPDESEEKAKKDAAEASTELMFGHVKLANDEMQGKKRKVSKHKELERAKKLEEVKKNDPEKGEAIAKKEAWKAAMDRSSGIKVHDDPKLIKKSIHKGKKRQEKNAEKWEERIQSREQLKAEKQKKRSTNIAERINDKKMRKIAKREKKLLRPGFEGRREGFINGASG